MDGTSIGTAAFLPATGASWQPNIGDYDGDGKTDVFWRNGETGEVAVWFMNGTTANGVFLPQIGTEWSAF